MKRKITLAVIAMAVSLTGIIVLQLYWINGAINVRSRQFDAQVFESINETAEKLQIHEAMLVLPRIMPEMDIEQRKTVDSFFLKRMTGHHGKFAFHHISKYKKITDDPFRKDTAKENGLSQNSLASDTIWMPGKSHSFDSTKGLMARAGMYNRLLKKMILNYINENKDINKRLTRKWIDSFLQKELSQRGISTPYQLGIYNKQNGKMVLADAAADASEIKRTKYMVKLFPDDLVPQSWYLAVVFPEKRKFVLNSIGLILPGSFLFMLIIIISCGFTIFMLLKQKKLSEMKNDFINNMTHEFKTPIATISLATDAINDPRISENKEKVRHYTSIIKEENNRMDLQVQKVLNAALMDKEDFKLNFDPLDAHEVIGKLIERFRLQIAQRSGTLTWHAEAKEHLIFADEVHFGNMINNLLDNANKYSQDAPDITVSTCNKNSDLIIEVEDHGIGMARETQKRIFDKFFRMSTGNIHDTKGFGLGLNYVKTIVNAHKGTIEVKSEIKKGSIFKIKIPLNKNISHA
jgi:two-component system, OmpR family, phosphate regulon sensor histidine kinase PhoR